MQKAACLTDKGRLRTINEDSMLCLTAESIYMAADGVGGHNSGELASSLAEEYIKDFIRLNPIKADTDDASLKRYFQRCLNEANEYIYKRASLIKENTGMATTAVILHIRADKAYVINIGDSRAYLSRDGQLMQITEDHTYVNELLKKGTITKEEAEIHPKRNMITRALGIEAVIEPDFYQFNIYKGDRILLCTDGLYNEVDAEDISRVASASVNPGVMARELIRLANENGGSDNVTVICVEI